MNNKPIRVTEIKLEDLTGEWIGHYRGHTDQVIKFEISGTLLVATKITGDEHVEGGRVTFEADLNANGFGRGQVAEKEFRNACWVPGRLVVIDKDHVEFTWESCGTVSFRKDS